MACRCVAFCAVILQKSATQSYQLEISRKFCQCIVCQKQTQGDFSFYLTELRDPLSTCLSPQIDPWQDNCIPCHPTWLTAGCDNKGKEVKHSSGVGLLARPYSRHSIMKSHFYLFDKSSSFLLKLPWAAISWLQCFQYNMLLLSKKRFPVWYIRILQNDFKLTVSTSQPVLQILKHFPLLNWVLMAEVSISNHTTEIAFHLVLPTALTILAVTTCN